MNQPSPIKMAEQVWQNLNVAPNFKAGIHSGSGNYLTKSGSRIWQCFHPTAEKKRLKCESNFQPWWERTEAWTQLHHVQAMQHPAWSLISVPDSQLRPPRGFPGSEEREACAKPLGMPVHSQVIQDNWINFEMSLFHCHKGKSSQQVCSSRLLPASFHYHL